MKARFVLLGAAIVAITLSAHPVHASTGGPEIAEMLGWDPVEQKVFCQITYFDETGEAPGIFYLDLKRTEGRWQRVGWSHVFTSDTSYKPRLLALRKGLRPLRAMVKPTIPMIQQVVGIDSLRRNRWEVVARYEVLVWDPFTRGALRVTTLYDPEVRIVRHFEVPGRPERVGVASFRGVPYESYYETQAPFLCPATENDTLRIERFPR